MNRIYQGRVAKVEIQSGKDPNGKPQWKELPDWPNALWQHHELFQDAVNYYTLALAAMAEGCLDPAFRKTWIRLAQEHASAGPKVKDSYRAKAMADAELQATAQLKALAAWREQVRDSWLMACRKAVQFPGPCHRVVAHLNINAKKASFDGCAATLFRRSPSTIKARAKALLQMMEEVDRSDLNQFCACRLPWLCTPHGRLDATPKNVVQQQETRMLAIVREIHEASTSQLSSLAKKMELGYFVTQMPKKHMTGAEARAEAERLFKSACAKAKGLASVARDFARHLDRLGEKLVLPCLGRKPKGVYPLAVVFKLLPIPKTWEVFKGATGSLRKKAERTKDSSPEIAADFIAETRTKTDQPLFDYFTNRALHRKPDNDNHAVWSDFDLASFIEAIKAPHRYFQDSIAREKAAGSLRKKKLAMEGRGGEMDDEHEEDEEGIGAFGFDGDERIKLLQELVKNTLGYVAEAEHADEEAERIEYTIQERTLRGFSDIKEKWRKLAANGQATKEKLLEVLAEQQSKHRDDFGSATLYHTLAQPKFHSIWRDSGTEKWHAADPLKAWRAYKELCFELQDKERLIRFTPAHAEHSPRYFIIPKQGRFGSDHIPGRLAFTCGVVLNTARGWEPTKVLVSYSAPRLRRDELRNDGKENLESVPWLQPMMVALGLDKSPDRVNFANCRITLQPANASDIQLAFPVGVNTEKIDRMLGCRIKWDYRISGKNRQMNFAQFNYSASEPRAETSLRWPSDIQFAKEAGTPRKSEPVPWHEKLNDFRCIATDLGQRDAGAFARLLIRCDDKFDQRPTRYIGMTGSKQWHAALERSGLFRLPGEDAQVWREKSRIDECNPRDSGKSFDFREELWGERGRPARNWEADETVELMRLLEVPPEDEELTLLTAGWRNSISFPEQNGKLLVAMRRYQSRIARLHRWCWFLKGDDEKQKIVWGEIDDCEDTRIATLKLKKLAKKRDPRAMGELESQLQQRLELAPTLLSRIANRVLPLRGRSWCWDKHPSSTKGNTLHHLNQNGPNLDSKQKPVWLRGQRGLSMERIEQIEELRKRFQSLNQMLRRNIGDKPPIRRDESVPDPCPDLLNKLDNIKEQRVNQTAHMILAEALGLRLAPPPTDKKALRQQKDQHGVYEKTLDKQGQWIGPVDFIVIEDLSRYRASQGRAPRENSRLMKWCHRAVRNKLKQLCEVFGIPVLETPAAYSSRFCSRSGVAGFRAVEVAPGFENEFPWFWLREKKDGDCLSKEAQNVRELIGLVKEANRGRDGTHKKYRTFLAPSAGGPIFVPIISKVKGAEIQPAVVQADINAAICLGLRAISDPRLWSIHPRLRTQQADIVTDSKGRNKGDSSQSSRKAATQLITREKRKFGEQGKPLVMMMDSVNKGSALEGTRRPNFFADLSGVAKWDFAMVDDPLTGKSFRLASGKSLWSAVKNLQWQRCFEVNQYRLQTWKDQKI